MSSEASKSTDRSDLPTELAVPPAVAARRLTDRLLPIGSLWFPTPRELRAWSSAGTPLYVRQLAPDRLEVGPRLSSMWAACFAPVWIARLAPAPGGARVRWHQRLPWFTLGLLAGWWTILIAWPLALSRLPESDDPGRWLVFWAFLLLASTLGPLAGWWGGRQALTQSAGDLERALLQPDVDEDW